MSILLRFILGGLIYMGMEVMFDNTSHRSMGIVGGLLFIICGSFDEWIIVPFWINCILIATVITITEYIAGRIVNKDHSVWDYRKIPFNLHGHICLYFYIIWMVVIAPVIILFDNYIR